MESRVSYLTGQGKRVIDIEEENRVLDGTLVERGVNSCGSHVVVCAMSFALKRQV